MFNPFDKDRLDRTRRLMRSEQLHKLKFTEAFRDQLAMTALLIDMTASFASPREYRRITDHCGSLSYPRKLHGKKNAKPGS